jgi:DnaK suppressor protein
MKPAELNHFRSRLERERADILREIAALQDQLAEDAEIAETLADENDAATLLVDQEEMSAERAQLQGALAQIDKALARIADRTYGISEVSGRPIPLERLEALPSATTLVDE